jgi:ubiquinone/menaquinone biosynthesis C-methylase UbiE
MTTSEIRQQYQTIDPLQTRILTHERYSERQIDLHAICREALALTDAEALLDVGCGPGAFLHYLRAHGHAGRLAGLDQSLGMIAAAKATAEAAGQAIEWFVGGANALPFDDGEWAIISARHMLYHVPDLPGALREFARVVGPDGRVLATTNAGTDHAGLNALRDNLFEHFALPVPPPVTEHFRVENARDVLQTVFAEVDETIVQNAFIFTAPEPIVNYLMTIAPVHRFEDDPARYRAIHNWLTEEATRRLAAMGGVWRDQKNVGVYVCRLG